MIRLLYFASMKESTGKASEQVEWTGGILKDVRDTVATAYPSLNWNDVRMALNEEFCPEDQPVHPGDTVAFIPPVSGG